MHANHEFLLEIIGKPWTAMYSLAHGQEIWYPKYLMLQRWVEICQGYLRIKGDLKRSTS